MPSTASGHQPGRPTGIRLLLPESHRLFGVFDDRATADTALDAGRAFNVAERDAWFYEGERGAADLDPMRSSEGVRLLSWIYSSNIEFLEYLSWRVHEGLTVMAVHVRNVAVAGDVALLFQPHGGEAFRYTSHWNYVPVSCW